MNKQIKLGAVISYLALIINTIASLIYIPWMVSIIGKTDYALYTLATTFISLFMVDFGLSSAVARFVAKYEAEGKKEKIEKLISTIERLYLYIGVVIFAVLIILYFFLDAIYVGLSHEELITFKKLYVIVAIYSVVSFPCMPFGGILTAYEKFIQLKLCDLVQKLLTIVFTVVILMTGGDVLGVVLSTAVSGVLVIGAKYVIIRRTTSLSMSVKMFDKSIAKDIVGFSVWVTVISLAQRCVFNLAPSILGIVSNSEEIAVLAPATTLEACFYQFSAAVNGLFLATVSRCVANNQQKQLFELMVKVGRYQLIVMGWIYAGFVIVGKDFMQVWMGRDFIKAWPCALMLFLPDVFLFTQQIANTAAIARNKVKQQAYGYIVMAIICVTISFLLGKRYGVIGTAIAITIAYTFLFIYMNILYNKLLHFNMILFFKKCYVTLLPQIVLIVCVSGIIARNIQIENLKCKILIDGIILTCLYFSCIYVTLRKDEKEQVRITLKKIIKRIK